MDKQETEASASAEKPMNLEEARKVMWLNNYHRPLGELFDEGYLNQARLEWAAGKAYDPKLRQAAGVLLNCLKQPSKVTDDRSGPPQPLQPSEASLQIDITIEKARMTIWPFAPYKGQSMGPLVETRQISLKDLGYAIENAWDEHLRRAAMALLLVRMKQAVKEPAPSAGFMHVVTGGRSFTDRRQFFYTLLEGFFLGVFFVAFEGAVFMVTPIVLGWFSRLSITAAVLASPAIIVALVIILVLVWCVGVLWLFSYLVNQVEKYFKKEVNNYRLGQEGEDRVIEVIRQALDGNWLLFRNVVLPGRNKSDMDAVLVGPCGVWVLEVKNLNGEYQNVGDQWSYRKGKGRKPAPSNPSRQAEGNAIRLSNFLKADGVKQWVTAAVIWANQESPLTVQNPTTAVWTFDRLPDELGNLWGSSPIPDATREKIVSKLTQLCQQKEGHVQ